MRRDRWWKTRNHPAADLGEVRARCAGIRTETNDDEVARRDDEGVLAHCSVSPIRIARNARQLFAPIQPEQSTVHGPWCRRRWRRDELNPAGRQDPFPVPHAVAQMQQAESCPISCREVVVAVEDEVTPS